MVAMAAHPGLSRASIGRWLVLLVALAGLMAMHGLSDHGVGGPVPLQHSSAMSGVASPGPAHDVEEPVGGHGDGHGGGHEGLLVGLCLAVLAAVLLVAGPRPHRRPFLAWRTHLGGVALALASAVRARARGPAGPDLRLLSVRRC